MLKDPIRVPVAVGLNITVIAQLALAAMLVPQLFVCEKSLAFVPVIAMPVKFCCVLPMFVIMML
jgi:hypothetical protein